MFPSKWMFVCLFTCFHSCSVTEASKEALDVKSGNDVILQCHGPKDAAMLEWTKPDMSSEEWVFFLREKRFYEDFQHPQFHGRVKLVDPEMKDGDFSVILKNVSIDDAGVYECHVGKSQSRRRKWETPELISRVILNVDSVWKDMEAQTGDPVTLPCQGPSSIPITSVKWIVRNKTDHVFFYHDGRTVSENQDPAYKNWVELKDSDLKNGDASLILKDVMNVDSGTYECWINERKTRIIDLYVYPQGAVTRHPEDGGDKDGGDKDEHVGMIVGLSVIGLLVVVVVVGFVGFLRKSFFPHVHKPLILSANNENFRLM